MKQTAMSWLVRQRMYFASINLCTVPVAGPFHGAMVYCSREAGHKGELHSDLIPPDPKAAFLELMSDGQNVSQPTTNPGGDL